MQLETAHLLQLLQSNDPAGWHQALFQLVAGVGFDQVLYAVVPSRHAQFEQAFLQSNYSPEWRARYDAERFAYIDPTVRHCLLSGLPVVWKPDTFHGAAEQGLYEEACFHRIRSGVTLPIHGPSGEFGVLSFTSSNSASATFERDVAHVMPMLCLVRDYAFASAQQFSALAPANLMPHLTRRELEVLNWVMAGKSSWEISMISRCSEATVNFHLANVRQKFNVNTRQQAVVKAISLGLINPEDLHR